MNSLEVIEKLCQIIEQLLDIVQDEAIKAELEAAYKEVMGEC